MHRLPPDVLNVVTQLLGVKELGRCSRASRILATAAVFGFEARAQERGPGLVLHARHAQRQGGGEPDWRKLCRKAMSLNRRRLRPPAPRRLKSVDPSAASARAAAAQVSRSDKGHQASQPKVHVYSRSFRRPPQSSGHDLSVGEPLCTRHLRPVAARRASKRRLWFP